MTEMIQEKSDEVDELARKKAVVIDGIQHPIEDLREDIETAHKELDEYKSGSLALSQNLEDAAKAEGDEQLSELLMDMSEMAELAYLRVHRGDQELSGRRDGKYSGRMAGD